jgi:hypothetical protein
MARPELNQRIGIANAGVAQLRAEKPLILDDLVASAFRREFANDLGLGDKAKDDYLLTDPTIRHAKAIVRKTTRKR